MDKFYALAAPIRREIIELLAESKELTATAIADKFQVSPSAISQHLSVLLNSDIVRMHKQAQQRIYELNSTTLAELEGWVNEMTNQIKNLADNTPTLKGAKKP